MVSIEERDLALRIGNHSLEATREEIWFYYQELSFLWLLGRTVFNSILKVQMSRIISLIYLRLSFDFRKLEGALNKIIIKPVKCSRKLE